MGGLESTKKQRKKQQLCCTIEGGEHRFAAKGFRCFAWDAAVPMMNR